MEARRNFAAEHSRSHGAPGSRLLRENVSKRATEKAGKRDLSAIRRTTTDRGEARKVFWM